MRSAGFEVHWRREHKAPTSPSLHARWSGKRLFKTSSLENPDSTDTDILAKPRKTTTIYYWSEDWMTIYCLNAVAVAVRRNEDVRHTGRCSLFFLPDDRRVRARAEVTLEMAESVTKYWTDRKQISGFHCGSAAIYELEFTFRTFLLLESL